ncbi:MAG: hypothetical protein ACOYN4_02975 [Bacteroidales bacterium]
MNSNKTFTMLLLLFGEALIIVSFLYFGQNLDTNVLALDIVISSVLYALFFPDIIVPMVDFNDKSQKTIGSLGLRWFVTSLYMIFSLGAIAIFLFVKPIGFYSQLILHSILLFLFILGIYMSTASSQRVHAVYSEEKLTRDHLGEMTKVTKDVMLKLEQMKDIPTEITSRLTILHENLRFISPCHTNDAYALESSFQDQMNVVMDSLFDIPINHDKIIENIQSCERTYKERKQMFAN